jgi:predicted RNase H-like nuclease (RuvC/YqgF family)
VGRQVRTFIKNEEQNYSLFNYVNEQQNEVEKLEETIQQLREEEVRARVCVRAYVRVCASMWCWPPRWLPSQDD